MAIMITVLAGIMTALEVAKINSVCKRNRNVVSEYEK